jgi:hypothetical protein
MGLIGPIGPKVHRMNRLSLTLGPIGHIESCE